jgi:hypothetical protein
MPINDPDGLAGVIDETLLAGAMLKAHDRFGGAAQPAAILNAEGRVLQTLGVLRLVLLPQQIPCDAWAGELALHLSEVRQWDRIDARLQGIQERLELRVFQLLG